MELKKALVLFGLLGVFASGFGAESSDGLKPLSPPSIKLFMTGTDEAGAVIEKRSADLKESKISPLNVVVLLVDELYRSDVPAYLENRDEFPVHGRLETCPAGAGSCDCDEKLGSSIASLVSWAQRANMSTISLYEVSTSPSDPRARLIYQRQDAPWTSKTEPSSDNEKAKIASKLKDTTFFRSLVNGLNTNHGEELSDFHRLDVDGLTSIILKEFSEPTQHGHLVITRIKMAGLSNVLKLFKRYVPPTNFLTVVVNSCPADHSNHLIPFFAGGLSSKQLSYFVNLKRLYDLPPAVTAVIDQHIKLAMISLPDESTAEDDRFVRNVYSGDLQRNKREPLDVSKCDDHKESRDQHLICIGRILKAALASDDCGDGDEEPSMTCFLDAMKPAIDHLNGARQNALAQSSMIITAVTATISYALKF